MSTTLTLTSSIVIHMFSLFSCIFLIVEGSVHDIRCDSPVSKDAPYLTSECKDVHYRLHKSLIRHQFKYVDVRLIIQLQ